MHVWSSVTLNVYIYIYMNLFCLQYSFLAVAGASLTMRLRQMSFRAIINQVSLTASLLGATVHVVKMLIASSTFWIGIQLDIKQVWVLPGHACEKAVDGLWVSLILFRGLHTDSSSIYCTDRDLDSSHCA